MGTSSNDLRRDPPTTPYQTPVQSVSNGCVTAVKTLFTALWPYILEDTSSAGDIPVAKTAVCCHRFLTPHLLLGGKAILRKGTGPPG